MWTRKFWLDALERAVKTGAQTLIAAWPTTAILLDGADWQLIAWTVAGAVGLSFLTSIAGSQVGNPESASMLPRSDEP